MPSRALYDVIVVGGGHAGCEAAAAAANLGSQALLITMNLQTIGQMSCNPAMGGVAKGQIIREIDALGGSSGLVSDRSMIQFRMLNKSKGPAMWSPRSQNDRMLFAQEWRNILESCEKLDFFQDMVTGLVFKGDKLCGVKTSLGVVFKTKTVILTAGTFLNGVIHVGKKKFGGGRAGEKAATGITKNLEDLGFVSGRMKTGTPPRVDGRSLDFSKMVEQFGDNNPKSFSFLTPGSLLKKQKSCYITQTNPLVHDLLRSKLSDSPLFSGAIQGIGPRYCPSVEDKIHRFATKESHQIFVEPEGWNTVECYINGFSTSLPEKTQVAALGLVPGFKNVKFFRPGYAIEYDYFPPIQLLYSLETKLVDNLFFAGQINGTTGYEEAAAQGLMAGINAHLKIAGETPFVLKRSDAFIGVLIDDLITKGVDEPYRMFTSRAEHRMLLRQDNADARLTPLGYKLGMVSKKRYRAFLKKQKNISTLSSFVKKHPLSLLEANKILSSVGDPLVKSGVKAVNLLKRPKISFKSLLLNKNVSSFIGNFSVCLEEIEQVEISTKYESYIKREFDNVKKVKGLLDLKIPVRFDYNKIPSLSFEGRDKLNKHQPQTISQASRISGVSPSDISVLLVYMGR